MEGESSIGVVLEMGNESREGKRRSEPSGLRRLVALRPLPRLLIAEAEPRPDNEIHGWENTSRLTD